MWVGVLLPFKSHHFCGFMACTWQFYEFDLDLLYCFLFMLMYSYQYVEYIIKKDHFVKGDLGKVM